MEIDKTYPYFGGTRSWIICNCGKRVRKLYRPLNRRYFRCRHCYDYLIYQSQESNVYDGFRRKMAKANGMTPKQYDRMVFGWYGFKLTFFGGYCLKGWNLFQWLQLPTTQRPRNNGDIGNDWFLVYADMPGGIANRASLAVDQIWLKVRFSLQYLSGIGEMFANCLHQQPRVKWFFVFLWEPIEEKVFLWNLRSRRGCSARKG